MVAYFYIHESEKEEALECGLKLSIYGKPIPESGEVPIKAIRALLSPRDDIKKFTNNDLVCLKLDLPGEKLLVAEELYDLTGNELWFSDSIIHAENYMLGSYRNPCFLIPFTVLSDYISLLDKVRDVPVLYEDSETLYIQTLRSKFESSDTLFYEKAFYGYMKLLVSSGSAQLEWSDGETAVFEMEGERYILHKPVNEI